MNEGKLVRKINSRKFVRLSKSQSLSVVGKGKHNYKHGNFSKADLRTVSNISLLVIKERTSVIGLNSKLFT